MSANDLPEGVIDADPPGGWESGAVADDETTEQSQDAEGSPALSTAHHDAVAEEQADGVDVDASSDGPTPPDGPVQSAMLGAHMDADLTTENPGAAGDEEESER